MTMTTTTLDRSFLGAIILMAGFRGTDMRGAQAGLIYLGLTLPTFTAAELPGELTNGSRHLAGAATGALIASGLVSVVGRVKSPRPEAKGRKVDLLAIPVDRRGAALGWLRANGYPPPSTEVQLSITPSPATRGVRCDDWFDLSKP